MPDQQRKIPVRNTHVERPGRKNFIPLENNPDVMAPLAHRLGLSPSLTLCDVLSLTDRDLLALVPRPCLALLFLYPVTESSELAANAEDDLLPPYLGSGPDEPALWFLQTIGNACGLINLLHCICNTGRPDAVVPGSDLERLIADATPLTVEARAQLLYDSVALEMAHAEAAHRGSSAIPDPSVRVGHAYVGFVKGKDGHLWELEGGRKGPLDRGMMADGEDLLSEAVIARGPGRHLAREAQADGNMNFSCLAVVPR